MTLPTSTLRQYIVLAVLAVPGAAVAGEGWWNYAWLYRRAVTIAPASPTKLPGEDVAVVRMPTGGLIAPDGSDIRVATARGAEVPCRVLMVGPGDQVRVAFAVRGGASKYFVYFGNPKPTPGKQLDIRRGVLLEMWAHPGGATAKLEQVKRIFKKANRLIGRDFLGRIFIGHNPFGPQNRIASTYTGYLVCPIDGKYTFATSSRNASFLLIDGELVIDNGGIHPPQRDIRKRAQVDLKAGLHKLTFYHVSGSGDPIAVVAWRLPNGQRVRPIPADAFAPVASAKCGAMTRYGRKVSIDFIPRQVGETFVTDRYFQQYRFRALAVGQSAGRISWHWDFGDGQTSPRPGLDHVYLLPGEYTVTLTGKTAIGQLKRINRIFVSRPWRRITQKPLGSIKRQGGIVSKYDFTALGPEAVTNAVMLLDRAGLTGPVLKAGEAFVAGEGASGGAVRRVLPIYADALIAAGHPRKALEALLKAEKMTSGPAVRAAMLVRAGEICRRELDKPDRALELFGQVIKRYAHLTSSEAIRQARIGTGDVWRARGDYDKAAAAYKAAKVRYSGEPGRTVFHKGDFARHVEDYLRRGELAAAQESLDRWEQAIPMDKLEGYSALLRVKLLLARAAHAAAAGEAETLVRVNPGSNYAAELLMLAADAYTKLGEADRAAAALKRIVQKYPESALAAEAAKKLKRP